MSSPGIAWQTSWLIRQIFSATMKFFDIKKKVPILNNINSSLTRLYAGTTITFSFKRWFPKTGAKINMYACVYELNAIVCVFKSVSGLDLLHLKRQYFSNAKEGKLGMQ